MSWEIREGDCLDLLRAMPDESVQCCVTSPPYWGLRDYGHGEQLGLEETPDQYVANMVEVFAEVRRVLRDDGTLWVNIGDSFYSSTATQGRNEDKSHGSIAGLPQVTSMGASTYRRNVQGLKPKDLCGIPWLLAFALRADGWYLRSEVIWAKPNPMPESVTDRPTKAHEQVFLLTKSPRYFYDADAVREAHETLTNPKYGSISKEVIPWKDRPNNGEGAKPGFGHMGFTEGGRNKRTVWTVTTQPFSGAHFATFPPKLIEPMILAGSPPKCCGVCAAPWQRVTERTPMVVEPTKKRADWQESDEHARTQTGGTMTQAPESKTVGWEPTCEHNDDTGSSVVLDPFSGSGTTGMVALRHDRSYIGLELNPEYAAMSRDRIRDDAPLLNTGIEAAA
jgi:DNA modification methylase